MRVAILFHLEYDEFEQIADLLEDSIPYGLYSLRYRKNLKKGIFQFMDEFYVPECLKQFISRPPGTDEKMEKLSMCINSVLHGRDMRIKHEIAQYEKKKKDEAKEYLSTFKGD